MQGFPLFDWTAEMNTTRIIATLTLLLFASAPSGMLLAKTYKWADSNGGIHYTQVPPTGKGVRILEVTGSDKAPGKEKKAAMPQAKTGSAENGNDGNHYNALVPEQQDPEAIARAEAERRKQQEEACDALRNNLRILEQNTRIRIRTGDDRQPRVLTPEEREERMRQYSESLDKMCK